jgi:RecA-family ATPase
MRSTKPDLAPLLGFVEQYGVPVFPCRRDDKTPLTAHGFQNASSDPECILAWGKRHPGCNWAMPTGAASGFVVLDVDLKNGKCGDVTLREFEEQHGRLPETPIVLTPCGGMHYWFRAQEPVPSSVDKVGIGLDIRGEGGYVMIPPSAINGHAYAFEASSDPADVPFAPMPAALVAAACAQAEPKTREQREQHSDDLLRNIQEGVALHDSLRDLAARYVALGMPFAEVCGLLQGLLRGSKAKRDDRWRERLDDIPKLVNSAIDKFRKEGAPREPLAWPAFIDLSALASRDAQPPRFIVHNWLPCGYASMFSGHGGVGKSGIALTLAACVTLGRPFFGVEVQQARVTYLSCEDREGALHWRLHHICRYLNVGIDALAGKLHIVDLVGKDAILWAQDRHTGNTFTPAFAELARRMEATEDQVLMVDGIADTYGGNENSRTEVKAYVNRLLSLHGDAQDRAALLVGHVNRQTALHAATSEGYSGATAWHNSVRGRWYLYPERDEDGGPGGDRGLLLEVQKQNFAPPQTAMRFRWNPEARLFVGKIDEEQQDAWSLRDTVEKNRIVEIVRDITRRGNYVPVATSGQRTTYHVLSAHPDFPQTLKSGGRRRFFAHLEQLRQTGELREEERRQRGRHPVRVLIPVPTPD